MTRWQKHITYNDLKSIEERFSENQIFFPGKKRSTSDTLNKTLK